MDTNQEQQLTPNTPDEHEYDWQSLDEGLTLEKLTLGGTSGVTMDLNPTGSFSLMKATLLRRCIRYQPNSVQWQVTADRSLGIHTTSLSATVQGPDQG